MKITRRQLRKLILEVYKPGIEKKIQRASVMDPEMLQNIEDLESSGADSMRQAQALAIAMGSEEDELDFIDAETYADIQKRNIPLRKNKELLGDFLRYFVSQISRSSIVNWSRRWGTDLKFSDIKTGLLDYEAFSKNLVGAEHAYAEVKLHLEGIPKSGMLIRIEDNMFANSHTASIRLETDPPGPVPAEPDRKISLYFGHMDKRAHDCALQLMGAVTRLIRSNIGDLG